MTAATVYVTKYALTSGILQMRGYITDAGFFFHSGTGNYYQRDEYCRTLQEAEQQANSKRRTRIMHLEQQIDRLRSLNLNSADPCIR